MLNPFNLIFKTFNLKLTKKYDCYSENKKNTYL